MLGCFNLGALHVQGTGSVQDAAKAAALFQKVCDGGDMESCLTLGILYAQGTGVVQDAAKAAAFYRKACDGGVMEDCSKAR